MKPQDTLDFHLRWTWTKLSRLYNAEAERRGIPFSYVFVLLHTERQGTPSTKLGPKMGMEPTSLSRTLKTMEEKGLIYREVDTEDKRKVLVFLTKDGLEKRRIARQVVLNFNDRIVSSIPKGKLKTFYEVAERLDMSIDRELSNF